MLAKSVKVAIAVAVLLVGIGSGVNAAFAIHRTYLQQDPAVHSRSTPFGFNAVSSAWVFYSPSQVSWDYDPTLDFGEVSGAIQEWESRLPRLDYQFTSGSGPWGAKLWFQPGTCPDDPVGVIGCWRVITYQDGGPRAAEYWFRAWIELVNPSDPAWTSQGRKDTLMHELGHFVGLHHQYSDDGDPITCSSVDSIMNIGSRSNGILKLVQTCVPGSHIPTTTDIGNAKVFWFAKNYDGSWNPDAHIKT
jgi:hypothetical protein